jgi:hypothetical protein
MEPRAIMNELRTTNNKLVAHNQRTCSLRVGSAVGCGEGPFSVGSGVGRGDGSKPHLCLKFISFIHGYYSLWRK